MDPKPTIGRIVLYRPFEHEVESARNAGGNRGLVLPATIVSVFSDEMVNLKVLTDGPAGTDFWATSRKRGADAGCWDWPPRV